MLGGETWVRKDTLDKKSLPQGSLQSNRGVRQLTNLTYILQKPLLYIHSLSSTQQLSWASKLYARSYPFSAESFAMHLHFTQFFFAVT